MKTRCVVMGEAMTPCDALRAVRFGAVRCGVVRWDGVGWNGVGYFFKRQVIRQVGR